MGVKKLLFESVSYRITLPLIPSASSELVEGRQGRGNESSDQPEADLPPPVAVSVLSRAGLNPAPRKTRYHLIMIKCITVDTTTGYHVILPQ